MINKLFFLYGVAVHVFRAITFRADGTGLPKEPGGALNALIALATITAVLRHAIMASVWEIAGLVVGCYRFSRRQVRIDQR